MCRFLTYLKSSFKWSKVVLALLALTYINFQGIVSVSAECNVQSTRLAASGGASRALLGASVAISGNNAFLGAPDEVDPTSSYRPGAVYVAKRNGGTWSISQKLTAPDNTQFPDRFGSAVAIDGTWAAVGARDAQVLAGAVYIYQFDGTQWIYRQKLTPAGLASNDNFGGSIAISGSTLVSGAYGRQSYTGAAYVYRLNGSTWTLTQTLTAPDGAPYDFFGYSVGLSGNFMVIGAYGDDALGSNSGSAYVYRSADNGATWQLPPQMLTAQDGIIGASFGSAVDIDGNLIAVTAPSGLAVYAFRYNGTNWVQESKLTASDGVSGDWFGKAVGVSQGAIVVGASHWEDESHLFQWNVGKVYYFTFDDATWREELGLVQLPQYELSESHLGFAVAIDGQTVLAGVPDDNLQRGLAYFFDVTCSAQAPVISQSTPPNVFVDALEDRDAANQSTLFGIRNVSLTFSEPVTSSGGSALGTGNFQVRCVRNGQAVTDLQTNVIPSVTQVTGSGAGPYQLQLSQRICLGAWTEIKAVNVVNSSGTPISTSGYDNRVVYGNLPMDTTQDGKVLGTDIDRWLAINNNIYNPAPLTKLQLLDQKRDGVVNGSDINRAIQLINGTAGTTFRAWSGFDMGVRP